MAQAWRTSPLPSNWASAIRPAVLTRDQYQCQIRGPRCTGQATEVDHTGASDDHRLEVLQSACKACHASKTGREARAARGPLATRMRPRDEGHPGLIDANCADGGGEGLPPRGSQKDRKSVV